MKKILSLALLSCAAALYEPATTLGAGGTVVGWGFNGSGQTTIPADLTNATAISAGYDHSLALRSDRTVAAWGGNLYGQTNVPPGLSNVVAISTRFYHNLALKSDGTVTGWGLDTEGQTDIPANLVGIKAVAAGNHHSLALRNNGTVVAWGGDQYGQTEVPPDLGNVVAISAGESISLALKGDGTVTAWGAVHPPPTNSDFVAISTGEAHNLGLRANHTVLAWGADGFGRLEIPADWTNIVQVAAGGYHNLARRANGTVVGSGLDDYGQTDVPSNVTNAVSIAAGERHSLAILSSALAFSNNPSAGRPTLTVTTPAANTRTSNAVVTVSGTARSTNGINLVYYQVNNGDLNSASSDNNFATWTAAVPLAAGTNVIGVFAVNNTGNVSTTNKIKVTYVVMGNLILATNGPGKITRNFTGNRLQMGANYTLTAAPAKGNRFAGWTGDMTSSVPRLTFTMDASMVLVANFVDGVRPVIAITSPRQNLTTTQAAVNMTGTVRDNQDIIQLNPTLNGVALAPIAGPVTNWTVPIDLAPGLNLFTIQAMDSTTNLSSIATRSIFRTVVSTLTTQTAGNGRITPNLASPATLVVGKSIQLTAAPARGSVFYQWTGTTNSFDSTLKFIMQSNSTLTATFVTNPYSPIQGAFKGLFFGTTNDSQLDAANSGCLSLSIVSNGTYTGKIKMLSGTFPISGRIHLDGIDQNVVVVPIRANRAMLPAMIGSIQLNLTNPSDVVTGELHQVSGSGTNATIRSAQFAGLMALTGRNTTDRGAYNFSLDPLTTDTNGPVGGSFGRLVIHSDNTATVVLSMADQKATATVGSTETQTGSIPFFAPLYNNKGMVSGWLEVTNGSLVASNIVWFKPANASKIFYPQGFLQTLDAAGARYTPTNRANVVQDGNGVITLSDGVAIDSTASFTVSNGVIRVPSGSNTNSITLSINPANGCLKGSFLPTGFSRPVPLAGILVPTVTTNGVPAATDSAPFGTGFFTETDRTGAFAVEFNTAAVPASTISIAAQ